ncbi:MAG: hypothetical protein HXX17_07015 [Geobacteraceae bacterium]|nr:hypothetical protein [Geobacteraceae bacterium]
MEQNATTENPVISKLTIDHGSTENPGLRFTYVGKSRLYSPSELLMLLTGIIFVVISLIAVYGNAPPPRWEGFIFLVVAAVFLVRFWDGRSSSGRLETLRYSVKVEDGKACFSGEDGQKVLDLSKLGRLWIATETTNGHFTAANITAYYDSDTLPVLCITDLYPRLGSEMNVVLEHIVSYLNSCAAETNKHVKLKTVAPASAPIQSGWRYDYAADTPLAARNVKPLADERTRLAFSAGIGLIAYLVYQSPLFSIQQHYYPLLVVLMALIGLPLLYMNVSKLVSACPCRGGHAAWCSVVIIVFSLALSYVLYLHVERGGQPLSPLVIAMIFILPTVWWIYYSISGCHCGARKVEQQSSQTKIKRKRR